MEPQDIGENILKLCDKQTQKEIRQLNCLMKGQGAFKSPEEWDSVFNKVRNHVCDILLSRLMREDQQSIDYFINHT